MLQTLPFKDEVSCRFGHIKTEVHHLGLREYVGISTRNILVPLEKQDKHFSLIWVWVSSQWSKLKFPDKFNNLNIQDTMYLIVPTQCT